MKKILKRIVDIICIIIIFILVVYFLLRITNKIQIYVVSTGSMEDNIHIGDYILIYTKDDYKVGDVVTFRNGNYLVTHRIIRKDNNNYITKGDANNMEDEEIFKKDIVGKVIISGGILNFIINYKYALVGFFLALYLVSCYFNRKETDN